MKSPMSACRCSRMWVNQHSLGTMVKISKSI
jgi:hypothetical protein